MHSVVYAPEAEAQLVALYFHIASAASPEVAANYTAAILKQCESLKTFPIRGTRRDDILPGLRIFGFRRRVTIAFEVTDDVVTILGIFYGGQNIESALEE
ncbi:MAG: type II toxin-antitoxin system RelE/ParE family toxin [Terracidiphilus sp.]|jgi:plasmid stabilization system protein ParE